MAEAYEKIDPLAVLPVYMQLIENEPSVDQLLVAKGSCRAIQGGFMIVPLGILWGVGKGEPMHGFLLGLGAYMARNFFVHQQTKKAIKNGDIVGILS